MPVRRVDAYSEDRSNEPFVLADGSGSIRVDPSVARVDRPEKVFEEYSADPTTWPSEVTLDIASANRIMGFSREEWVITVGQTLYVVGEVTRDGGAPIIGKPADPDEEILISTRSEQAHTQASAQGVMILFAAAALSFVAAAVALSVVLVGLVV